MNVFQNLGTREPVQVNLRSRHDHDIALAQVVLHLRDGRDVNVFARVGDAGALVFRALVARDSIHVIGHSHMNSGQFSGAKRAAEVGFSALARIFETL